MYVFKGTMPFSGKYMHTYYYTGQYFDAFYGLNKERESIQTRGLLPSTSPT